MLIPLPLLMFWATLTGQPVTVIIVPNALPVISQPAPQAAADEPAGCRRIVCAA